MLAAWASVRRNRTADLARAKRTGRGCRFHSAWQAREKKSLAPRETHSRSASPTARVRGPGTLFCRWPRPGRFRNPRAGAQRERIKAATVRLFFCPSRREGGSRDALRLEIFRWRGARTPAFTSRRTAFLRGDFCRLRRDLHSGEDSLPPATQDPRGGQKKLCGSRG